MPIRTATEIYRWRDQPLAGVRVFTARNVPLGALIDYALDDEQSVNDSVHIQIVASDGSVVRELAGPATPGLHRVEWDLRMQFAFVPPPADSGYYGAPRAAFVQAGHYVVRLRTTRGSAEQPVLVLADPKATTTPEALGARWALAHRVDSLSRVYLDAHHTLVAADSDVARLRASLATGKHPAALDTALAGVDSALAIVRPRLGSSYPTPIGQAFDVLGGVESSWAGPTVAEGRTLDRAIADLRDAIVKLNGVVTGPLAKLRAAAGALPAATPGRP